MPAGGESESVDFLGELRMEMSRLGFLGRGRGALKTLGRSVFKIVQWGIFLAIPVFFYHFCRGEYFATLLDSAKFSYTFGMVASMWAFALLLFLLLVRTFLPILFLTVILLVAVAGMSAAGLAVWGGVWSVNHHVHYLAGLSYVAKDAMYSLRHTQIFAAITKINGNAAAKSLVKTWSWIFPPMPS